jgi:alpha-beta hydrolase superfamily lysophospholipase
VQTWVDLLDALKPLTASQNVGKIRKELPILLIAGTRDAVGDMGEGSSGSRASTRAPGSSG